MMTFIITMSIILFIFIVTMIWAFKTAEPYPKEWEEAENEKFKKELDEYNKSRN